MANFSVLFTNSKKNWNSLPFSFLWFPWLSDPMHVSSDNINLIYLIQPAQLFRVRKQLSTLLCPVKDELIQPDGPKMDFVKCVNETKLPISSLSNEVDLRPLTAAKHIISVSYDNEDVIDNKINKNLILWEKILI